MTTIITTQLEAIRKRADAATAGPWFADEGPEHGCCWDTSITVHDAHEGPKGQRYRNAKVAESNETDAAFIAHARTDVPRLLEALAVAIRMLERNAKPALGGKQQQYDAQDGLAIIAAILSKA